MPKKKDNVIAFESPSFYALLGMTLELNQRTMEPEFPDTEQVEREFREAVVASHPSNHPDDARDYWDGRFREVMEAGQTLLDPVSRAAYHDYLTSEVGHAGWLKSPERQIYTVDPLPDWLEMLVGWLSEDAMGLRGEFEESVDAMGALSMGLVPAYVPGERLAHLDDLDVGAVVQEVLDDYAEDLFDLHCLVQQQPRAIGWTWRRKAWSAQGAVAIGKARKLSDRERARMPGSDAERPFGELQLALSYWLVADNEERRRLVFHELCHFTAEANDDGERKLKVVGHDIETFALELKVFGLRDREQAEAIVAAVQHPSTAQRLDHYGVLPDDQLVLFRKYFDEAEALDDHDEELDAASL